MAKQWKLERKELVREPIHGKLHNPSKFLELRGQLNDVCERSCDHNAVNRVCRKLIEEVSNIAQHNQTWTEMKVRTEFNSSGKTYKIHIQYDGGMYYDPSHLPHVMDTGSKFLEYKREWIESSGIVDIRLTFKI